jgi:hypothetical protein
MRPLSVALYLFPEFSLELIEIFFFFVNVLVWSRRPSIDCCLGCEDTCISVLSLKYCLNWPWNWYKYVFLVNVLVWCGYTLGINPDHETCFWVWQTMPIFLVHSLDAFPGFCSQENHFAWQIWPWNKLN